MFVKASDTFSPHEHPFITVTNVVIDLLAILKANVDRTIFHYNL